MVIIYLALLSQCDKTMRGLGCKAQGSSTRKLTSQNMQCNLHRKLIKDCHHHPKLPSYLKGS